MTGEIPPAHVRPPEFAESAMFTDKLREYTFHDYARADSQNKMVKSQPAMKTWTPYIIIPEHSLATDCNVSVLSPGNGLMYENDLLECNKALLSPSTSDALPSPNCSWKRDAWDQSIEYGEDRIDLTSYNSSTFWGQMDGPPMQEYLTDISNSTMDDMRNELAALADPQVPHDGEDKISSGADGPGILDVHCGLKDEGSRGPTLAQLNDRESVLDGAPITQTTQSWVSSNLHQSDAITSLSAAAWSPLYMTSSSPTICKVSTHTHTTQYTTPPPPNLNLTKDVGLQENKTMGSHTRLAALLAADRMPSVVMKPKQEVLEETAPAKIPVTSAALISDLPTVHTTVTAAVGQVHQTQVDVSTKRRSQSPDQNSNSSSSSMERKWAEIRDYIDSNRTLEESKQRQSADQPLISATKSVLTQQTLHDHDQLQQQDAPLLKKIKIEPEDSEDEADYQKDDLCDVKMELHSDYDNSDDDLSDVDSDCSYTSFIDDMRRNNKKDKRHFWQYNTQSKGPKGKRLCKSVQVMDAHCLADFEDPVFQPDCADARYKHNGKARKGDGNDITPSPWKLFQIGNELMKLNKKINRIGSDVPVKTKDGVKSKSRREKNKFASRACRLKKKAQHEAYKLKLYGLEEEHHQLIEVLSEIKGNIYKRVNTGSITGGESFVKMYDKTVREHLTVMIAGNTTDYVNTVLGKVADGDRTGGLFLHRQ